MAQYIPKSTLVAEIEKQMERAKFEAQQAQENNDYVSCVGWSEHFATCGDILRIINTLEVKEVDLEKELDYDDYVNFFNEHPDYNDRDWGFTECWVFAKHFFELGLRSTITEEDCKLIWNIGDEIPNMPEEEFYKELLRRYKAQKGE